MARHRSLHAVVAFVSVLTGVARADEGMWTFGRPPLVKLQWEHDFSPDAKWFDHLRLASVRVCEQDEPDSGGSGCFVGEDGLVLTCRHVVAGLLAWNHALPKALDRQPVVARSSDEEIACPDLEVEVLTSMEDVSAEVDSFEARELLDSDVAGRRALAILRILAREERSATRRAEVVSLYGGAQHWLYRYDRFRDVRLVFLPEPFEIPDARVNAGRRRFGRFDAALLRVYVDGKPFRPRHHLVPAARAGSPTGFVAAYGNPGRTNRLLSAPEFDFARSTAISLQIGLIDSTLSACERFFRDRPDLDADAEPLLDKLRDDLASTEAELEFLNGRAVVACVHSTFDAIRERLRPNPVRLLGFDRAAAFLARQLVDESRDAERAFWRAALDDSRARLCPSFRRTGRNARSLRVRDRIYPQFSDPRGTDVVESLHLPARFDFEVALVGSTLENVRASLGGDDPLVRELLGDRATEQAATSICARGLRPIPDDEIRFDYLPGLTPRPERLDRDVEFEEAIDTIAEGYHAAFGDAWPPDADGSPRFSFGKVSRSPLSLHEFVRECDRERIKVPEPWRAKFDHHLATIPWMFVTNLDCVGGFSGGPVVDRQGALLGIASRAQSSAAAWSAAASRTVAVDVEGILIVLRRVYGADSLADEIEGFTPK